MSFSQTQLTTLLHAVERLLEAHAGLRGELHEANARLEKVQTKLQEVEMVRETNLPQPQPTPEPAMSAEELDALVEEIDECITLLKA
jgi:chromosome segregation ATPase